MVLGCVTFLLPPVSNLLIAPSFNRLIGSTRPHFTTTRRQEPESRLLKQPKVCYYCSGCYTADFFLTMFIEIQLLCHISGFSLGTCHSGIQLCHFFPLDISTTASACRHAPSTCPAFEKERQYGITVVCGKIFYFEFFPLQPQDQYQPPHP